MNYFYKMPSIHERHALPSLIMVQLSTALLLTSIAAGHPSTSLTARNHSRSKSDHPSKSTLILPSYARVHFIASDFESTPANKSCLQIDYTPDVAVKKDVPATLHPPQGTRWLDGVYGRKRLHFMLDHPTVDAILSFFVQKPGVNCSGLEFRRFE